MTIAENWRDIPGYEGRYMVSDLGRVRSFVRPRFLKLAYDHRGALVVSLPCAKFKSGYRATKVHLLVLLAFKGPCPKGQVGRHLDGNPYNNALSNLAYGTPQDNMDDRERHGHTVHGEKNGNAKLTEEAIAEIRASPKYKGYQLDLAKKFGVTQSVISHVVVKRSWRHIN